MGKTYKGFSKGNLIVLKRGIGHILIDFDGTLKKGHDLGPAANYEPIEPLLSYIYDWLHKGYDVRIFTARASDPDACLEVDAFCLKHLGRKMHITNQKDYSTVCYFDDRAIQVQPDTGIILEERLVQLEDIIRRATALILSNTLLPAGIESRIVGILDEASLD